MLTWIKNNRIKLIFTILYILLFIPMLYAIYYSVPASDDFAMALGRDNYANSFVEFFAAVGYFWMHRGGTIIWFGLEFLINPLNLHVHLRTRHSSRGT